jgi:hypothetical protein
MELIGLQFEDFACFKLRSIPLKSGVQILVGKNNAGKTAILRGLAAIRSIPVGDPSPIDAHLAGYVPAGADGFGMNLWCSLQDEDWPHLLNAHRDQTFPDHRQVRFVLRFRFWPDMKVSGLVGGEIRIGEKSLPILEKNQGNYVIRRIEKSGLLSTSGSQLVPNGFRPGPGGNWAILKAEGLLAEIPKYMPTQLIDARRIVQSGLPWNNAHCLQMLAIWLNTS